MNAEGKKRGVPRKRLTTRETTRTGRRKRKAAPWKTKRQSKKKGRREERLGLKSQGDTKKKPRKKSKKKRGNDQPKHVGGKREKNGRQRHLWRNIRMRW